MPKRREAGPHRARLTPETIDKIVGLIGDWPANRVLTWEKVLDQAETYLRHRWTRQGLERHGAIKQAFETKRRVFHAFGRTGRAVKRRSPEREACEQSRTRLAQELAEVRSTLARYDDLFVRHHANALGHGLTIQQLEAQLLPPDRRRTDGKPKAVALGA